MSMYCIKIFDIQELCAFSHVILNKRVKHRINSDVTTDVALRFTDITAITKLYI